MLTWQRHRTMVYYMGGGPGTAIYKSIDGGENWKKLVKSYHLAIWVK